MKTLVLLAIASVTGATLSAQTLQYTSPAGVAYHSLPDSGPIARAQAAVRAEPRNVQRYLELGAAQAAARQMREAVETYTRALEIEPNNPMLYRWRGHRYLSTRDLDRAQADLTRGLALGSSDYGLLYHLGIVHFARGEFAPAIGYFERAIQSPPNAGELAGSTDWLWMSLMRAGRAADARALLARRPDSLPVSNAYATRLRLYRGEITPEQVVTAADTADVQLATLSYGVGNWYLVQGDTARARAWFERAVRSGGWPGFGFIVAEHELRRLGAASGTEREFSGVQQRGAAVMGVDQYLSKHVFEDLPDGGRIVLRRDDPADTAAVRAIRLHMRDIEAAFRRGDFSSPFRVHGREVPGTRAMTDLASVITYGVSDVAGGAALRIRSKDRKAVAAIHQFLAFQRSDHRAPGHEAHPGHKPAS